MRPLNEVIKELRRKHGNQSQVAKKIGISSQLLGQYENGRQEPKIGFFEKWLTVFNEDIRAVQKRSIAETNVSHETKKPTPVQNQPAVAEKPLRDMSADIINVIEGNTEYVMIPRSVLKENYRIVPLEQFEKDKKQMEMDAKELEERARQVDNLMGIIRDFHSKPINIHLPEVKKA